MPNTLAGRIARIALPAALALAPLALTGCGGGNDDAETDAASADNAGDDQQQPSPLLANAGVYELDREAMKTFMREQIEAMEDGPEKTGASMMVGMVDQMSITMTLNDDGSAAATTNMMGQTDTATGTWETDGESVTIAVAPEGDEPEPASGTLENGRLTLIMPDTEPPMNLILVKQTG